jgi:hypothetical protein
MSAQTEIWRVSTAKGTFETDLESLIQRIVEGTVLPTDKVSKGNLSWIEAGHVPTLKRVFDREAGVTGPPSTTVCQNHSGTNAAYVCRMCDGVFCKACPKFVGKVPVCPACGDLCHEYRAVTERWARAQLQSSKFGLSDLIRAIGYPFQHKTALLSGAVIFGILLYLGNRGNTLAWVFTFACVSQVITQVAWGRLNRSFMPDFSEFSCWDDVLVPSMLGFGVTIVSWGPAIALVFVTVFKASDPDAVLSDLLPYLAARPSTLLVLLLFIVWGVFYYPMALTVAGYTQSFASVINPLIGLDTIRRMRTTYFKAFAMVIVVYVIAFILNAIVSVVTPPLARNIINAPLTFYFNLVVACILGLSLFKCADRLDISVD